MEDQAPGSLERLERDLRFHGAILQATHNEPLISMSSVIGSTLRWSVRLTLTATPHAHRDSLPEHKAVSDAIRSTNSERARRPCGRSSATRSRTPLIPSSAKPEHGGASQQGASLVPTFPPYESQTACQSISVFCR
jgi:hypothetical protein